MYGFSFSHWYVDWDGKTPMREIHAWTLRIEGLIECQRLEDARKELSIAYREYPDSTQLKYLEAKIESECGQHGIAFNLLYEALQKDPEDAEYRIAYFHECLALDYFTAAETAIIELIKDFPEHAHFYSCYALLMLQTFHIQKAQQLAQEAIRLDPEDWHAQFIVAYYEYVAGDPKKGEALIRNLLQTNPDNEYVKTVFLVQLMGKGKYKLALMIAQELLARNPNDEDYVDYVVELKALSHPISKLYYLQNRFGFLASAIAWISVIGITKLLFSNGYTSAGIFIIVAYALWAISSWFVPALIKGYFRRGLANAF